MPLTHPPILHIPLWAMHQLPFVAMETTFDLPCEAPSSGRPLLSPPLFSQPRSQARSHPADASSRPPTPNMSLTLPQPSQATLCRCSHTLPPLFFCFFLFAYSEKRKKPHRPVSFSVSWIIHEALPVITVSHLFGTATFACSCPHVLRHISWLPFFSEAKWICSAIFTVDLPRPVTLTVPFANVLLICPPHRCHPEGFKTFGVDWCAVTHSDGLISSVRLSCTTQWMLHYVSIGFFIMCTHVRACWGLSISQPAYKSKFIFVCLLWFFNRLTTGVFHWLFPPHRNCMQMVMLRDARLISIHRATHASP